MSRRSTRGFVGSLCFISLASGLRIAACIGAAWLMLSGAAADPFQLRDEVGKFAATFPAEPALDKAEGASESGPHVHYTWGVDVEERHFSVTYTEYRTPPAKNYDKNVMLLLKATNGRLVSQAKLDLAGIDGREVVTLLPNNAVLRQRLFQVGNRLYQAVYGGPFGTETRADVETFMTSFQLLK
ncbi:MAG: hypothetical protein WAN86_14355 [Hyphomicrobiaceae bacterium]